MYHDIAEILLKLASNTNQSINQSINRLNLWEQVKHNANIRTLMSEGGEPKFIMVCIGNSYKNNICLFLNPIV
jgi:hypothetical protein